MGSRESTPTPTSYVGTSTRAVAPDSHRQPEPGPYAIPTDDFQAERAQFLELHEYLASYLANQPANPRASTRHKLSRLTRSQLGELTTDVYEELLRRKGCARGHNEVPFLPPRDGLHPKRNLARQKLATLRTGRFKDLAGDVHHELARRYPGFAEEKAPCEFERPCGMGVARLST